MSNNIYSGNSGLTKGQGFSAANGIALCGYQQNQYNPSALSLQAKIGDLEPNTLLPCTPVVIKNDTAEALGTDSMVRFNPKNFVIEKAVTAHTDVIDGFILESPSYITDEAGNGGLVINGGMAAAAKIGSGVEVFLPANANLINTPLSTALYWDPAANELTKETSNTILLKNVQMLSSVIKGRKRKLNSKSVEWADVTCVLVRL